ncbi:MAG TPA: DcaP family trimeric outer membrane transporter [Edaphobacter sp.]|nr:DcaP family trimeric outer membrane transporter [Edaphobacter sp.]
MRSNQKNAWGNISLIALLFLSVIWIPPVQAQSQNTRTQDIQQLKDKLQQLEQMMGEVKGQITALENQPGVRDSTTGIGGSKSGPSNTLNSSVVTSPDNHGTVAASPPPSAQAHEKKSGTESTFDIYGYAQMDSGYDFGQIDPSWFDVMRPTKLPAFANQFGQNGQTYFSVRQTRFGVKTSTPTSYGDLKTIFEFELFGTGVDAGQTTFRLRHAWGEMGHFGAGQTWSPFMDPNVFPNSLEYWGPNGMVFFRNVQFRWTPIKTAHNTFMIAAERPGASADQGVYSGRIELSNITPQFILPDLSMQGHFERKWGYFQIASMFRRIAWVDNNATPQLNLGGSAFGWGINASSNIKFGEKTTGKLQLVYGHGIQNYMNDAPVDIGIQNNFSNPVRPIKGVPLPILGAVAFVDHNWSPKFSSTFGGSMVNIWNSDAQSPSDFHQGYYALTNLLYYPVKNVMAGGEFQFGRRVNLANGFNFNDYRVQFSFKYSYGKTFVF